MEDQDSNNQLNQILPSVQASKPFLCLYSGSEFFNTTICPDELLLRTQGKMIKIASLNVVAQSLSGSPKEEDDYKTSSEDSPIFGTNLYIIITIEFSIFNNYYEFFIILSKDVGN